MTRSRGEVIKAFGQEIREIFAASVALGPRGHRYALDLRGRRRRLARPHSVT